MFAVLRFPWNDWVEEKKPAWARPLTKVVLGFLGAKSRRCQVSGYLGGGGFYLVAGNVKSLLQVGFHYGVLVDFSKGSPRVKN